MTPARPANPHIQGTPEAELWEVCVRRDIESFVAADWSICADDFDPNTFAGWDARFSSDPMRWEMRFPRLEDYKLAWLRDARAFAARSWRTPMSESLHAALSLSRIEPDGEKALVHKRFDGQLLPADGDPIPLRWQSVFHLRKYGGRWLQCGFVGYLPL